MSGKSLTLDNRRLLTLLSNPEFQTLFGNCLLEAQRNLKRKSAYAGNCKPCQKKRGTQKSPAQRIDLQHLKLCMSQSTPKAQSELCRLLGVKEVIFYVPSKALSKTSVAAVRFVDRLP